jgi:hypothetical protein
MLRSQLGDEMVGGQPLRPQLAWATIAGPLVTGCAELGTWVAADEHLFDHAGVAQAERLARDLGETQDRLVGRAGVAATDAVGALAERLRPTDLALDRSLAVLPAFDALLPASGLRRGTTAAIDARPGVTGATSLALALAAGASQAGSWVAAVGLGSLGLVAAAELGVSFERLVLVADPGREPAGWATVVAALVDGFDIVLVAADGGRRLGGPGSPGGPDGRGLGGPGGGGGVDGRGLGGNRLRAGDARRLVARVRERGAVLVAVGGELPGERSPLRLTVTASTWQGLGEGWGHLQGRRVTVEARGRGEAARGRRAELWLPGPDGTVAVAEPVAAPIPLRPRGAEAARPPEVSAEGHRERAVPPTARSVGRRRAGSTARPEPPTGSAAPGASG